MHACASNRHADPQTVNRKHELIIKKGPMNRHPSPHYLLSATGGLAYEATTFYN